MLKPVLVVAVGILSLVAPAAAQQVTIGTPFQSVNNSYFDNTGVGFGFSIRGSGGAFPPGDRARGVIGVGANGQLQPNLNFQQNIGAGAPLGVGGNPATFGFGLVGGFGSAFFNVSAGQGSSSSITSQTPMITVMNGQTGSFSATTQRPFVMGFVPVVGAGGLQDPGSIWNSDVTGPSYTTELQEKLDRIRRGDTGQPRKTASGGGGGSSSPPVIAASSSVSDTIVAKLQSAKSSTAGQSSESIRDIQGQQAAEEAARDRELTDLLDKAKAAEAEGKPKIARIHYEQAARRAEGSMKLELLSKVRELGGK